MTHTPGPWRIQPTSMKGQYLVQGGDIRSGDGFSLQFSEVNARLIAAAPDLLIRLKHLADIAHDLNATQHSGAIIPLSAWGDLYQATCEARAAIAKAEEHNG